MKYSPRTGGFYPEELNYKNLPDDIVEVSQEDYQKALNTNGKIIYRGGKLDCLEQASPMHTWDENSQSWQAPNTKDIADQLQLIIDDKVSFMLDELAKTWGYSSFMSSQTYFNSNYKKFEDEAKVLLDWCSAIWSYIDINFGQLETKRNLPTDIADFDSWIENNITSKLPPAPNRP